MLAESLRTVRIGVRVLDVGTGPGVLALAAARGGAAQVIAVDICARAVFTARVNALLRRLPVRVLRSDLLEAVDEQAFDVIVANPPYVCSDDRPGARKSSHTWDGGTSGRAVLDRLCSAAPSLPAPGGTLLLVQSALCGIQDTLERLRSEGLTTTVIARRQEPFGPVMRTNAIQLEDRGLIAPEQRCEDLVVIRADRDSLPKRCAAWTSCS